MYLVARRAGSMLRQNNAMSHVLSLVFISFGAAFAEAADLEGITPQNGGSLCALFLEAVTPVRREGALMKLRVLALEATPQVTLLKFGAWTGHGPEAFLAYQQELADALSRFDSLFAPAVPLALSVSTIPVGREAVASVTRLANALRPLSLSDPAVVREWDPAVLVNIQALALPTAASNPPVLDEVRQLRDKVPVYDKALGDLRQLALLPATEDFSKVLRAVLSAVGSADLAARGAHRRHREACVESATAPHCLGQELMAITATMLSDRIAFAGAVILLSRMMKNDIAGPQLLALAREAVTGVDSARPHTPWTSVAQALHLSMVNRAQSRFDFEALLGRSGAAGALMTALRFSSQRSGQVLTP